MKASRFAYGLAAVLATALLASCGGSPTPSFRPPGVSGNLHTQSVLPLRGGAFKGGYSGTYTYTQCVVTKTNGLFQFGGTGSASFLHKSSEMGTMFAFSTGPHPCLWVGSAVLTSARHADDTIKVSLMPIVAKNTPPCSVYSCPFSIKSGTGRFAHATGSGNFSIKIRGSNSYRDAWSGMLQF